MYEHEWYHKNETHSFGEVWQTPMFKNFDTKKLVTYTNSLKGWMTTVIFSNWLMDWDLKLQKEKNFTRHR